MVQPPKQKTSTSINRILVKWKPRNVHSFNIISPYKCSTFLLLHQTPFVQQCVYSLHACGFRVLIFINFLFREGEDGGRIGGEGEGGNRQPTTFQVSKRSCYVVWRKSSSQRGLWTKAQGGYILSKLDKLFIFIFVLKIVQNGFVMHWIKL